MAEEEAAVVRPRAVEEDEKEEEEEEEITGDEGDSPLTLSLTCFLPFFVSV